MRYRFALLMGIAGVMFHNICPTGKETLMFESFTKTYALQARCKKKDFWFPGNISCLIVWFCMTRCRMIRLYDKEIAGENMSSFTIAASA